MELSLSTNSTHPGLEFVCHSNPNTFWKYVNLQLFRQIFSHLPLLIIYGIADCKLFAWSQITGYVLLYQLYSRLSSSTTLVHVI